jgi:membrane protein required for colicin V production
LIVLVLLAGATSLPSDGWWQHSLFIRQLENGAVWVRGYLPGDIARAITYPDQPTTVPADEPVTKAT